MALRARRGAKAWCFVTKGFRTIMADASKRMLGVHDISLGTCFNYSLGIAFIGEEKRRRAEDSLRVYARLNPGSYDKLLTRAASADVLSVSVASLPPLSSELAIRQLLGLSLVDALAASA